MFGTSVSVGSTPAVSADEPTVARYLLGIIAALEAVLIPGEAGRLMSTRLAWPRLVVPNWLARDRHAEVSAVLETGDPQTALKPA